MKIKICGLTTILETTYVNESQADFAGMVLFFPKSKRNITISQARILTEHLNPEIQKVAVVVSPTLSQIRTIEEAGFDYIQIHGELPLDLLEQIHLPVLKAFNVSDMNRYEEYRSFSQVAGYVWDAQEPGSGKVFDWNLAKSLPRDDKLWLLAGGLNPDNVASAIKALQPDGVDVSSGVEYDNAPGKDPEKIRRFVTSVRAVTD